MSKAVFEQPWSIDLNLTNTRLDLADAHGTRAQLTTQLISQGRIGVQRRCTAVCWTEAFHLNQFFGIRARQKRIVIWRSRTWGKFLTRIFSLTSTSDVARALAGEAGARPL
jgi:hypothetical protein